MYDNWYKNFSLKVKTTNSDGFNIDKYMEQIASTIDDYFFGTSQNISKKTTNTKKQNLTWEKINESYVLEIHLPGYFKNEISITQTKIQIDILAKNIKMGQKTFSISLPVPEIENVEASLQNGILKIICTEKKQHQIININIK